MVLCKLPQLIRTESSNEAVISELGSPLVKQARESTSNDLTKSRGAIRVAPSAKVGGSPVVCLSKILSVLNCLSTPQFSVSDHNPLNLGTHITEGKHTVVAIQMIPNFDRDAFLG
jgi:hypothetical protein